MAGSACGSLSRASVLLVLQLLSAWPRDGVALDGVERMLQNQAPAVDDKFEDDDKVELPSLAPGIGTLMDRWNKTVQRCCSAPLDELVIDTHFHVWDEDPRPNRNLNQLGLMEDVVTEAWGEGIHLTVLVQPGFRNDNNTYITRILERMPGASSAEVEYVVDYSAEVLEYYHSVGVSGLRFKATSLEKYENLITPRLQSPEFNRIKTFMLEHDWHYGVQLSSGVAEKWDEILPSLQATGIPIIVDMFGRPNPDLDPLTDIGTTAILKAAGKKEPAGKIWIELGGPFRVDPRCTYALRPAAKQDRLDDRCPETVPIKRRRNIFENVTEERCCPKKTHELLIRLADAFISVAGEDYVIWGSDWPFITDIGVTFQGLLDAVYEWVPDAEQRRKVLGLNAIRPYTVGHSALYPFQPEWAELYFVNYTYPGFYPYGPYIPRPKPTPPARRLDGAEAQEALQGALQGRRLQQNVPAVNDNMEDLNQNEITLPSLKPGIGSLMDRWAPNESRCCSLPIAPLVIDTHVHIWDEDPRPNRGLNQLGLIEDYVTEAWGTGIHSGVFVQPGFRNENNTYILKGLDKMPGRWSGEVEYVIDYDSETLREYHLAGVRGLRFKATSLGRYEQLIAPRIPPINKVNFTRIANFMKANDWHYGVQLSAEAGSKWDEILEILQNTGIPIIVDMFGRPDPELPPGEDIGTKAILKANKERSGPAFGKIWMEFGAPFRVDPRCTYSTPEAALPERCLPNNRLAIPTRNNGETRVLCCPYQTHELLVSLADTFIREIGSDYILWGTDWPFISDTGVTLRGLLDAMATWVPDGPTFFKAMGLNAVRPNAVGNSPMYTLLQLDGVPTPPFHEPFRFATIVSDERPADAIAFHNGLIEAKAAGALPINVDAKLIWQNGTDSLASIGTACNIIKEGFVAVVGPPTSGQADAMQTIFHPFGLPVIGYSATDPALNVFPNFIRMVPSDALQSRAAGFILQFYGWRRVAATFQSDSYGINGLRGLFDWAQETGADVMQVRLDLTDTDSELTASLRSIRDNGYMIVVANLCCHIDFVKTIFFLALELNLMSRGYFWLFSDGVAAYMASGRMNELLPLRMGRPQLLPGLWGTLADGNAREPYDDNAFLYNASAFGELGIENITLYSAILMESLFALGFAMANTSREVLFNISSPSSCGLESGTFVEIDDIDRLFKQRAGNEFTERLKQLNYRGLTGDVAFDEHGNRISIGFKAVNLRNFPNEIVGVAGRVFPESLYQHRNLQEVDAENMELRSPDEPLPRKNLRQLQQNQQGYVPTPGFEPVFLGPTRDVPLDRRQEDQSLTFLALAVMSFMVLTLMVGCMCEVTRKAAGGSRARRTQYRQKSGLLHAGRRKSDDVDGKDMPDVMKEFSKKLSMRATQRLESIVENQGLDLLPKDPEPCHGFPPPHCRRPIIGDFIAGGVKAIIELVAALTFAALMTPDDLTRFLPVFLNYAIFGYIISQVAYNLSSKYVTPVRTANISGSIFLLDVLSRARQDLEGDPQMQDKTINTVLFAAAMMAWLAGLVLYFIGAFKLTQFVRFLSAPVKLGMQASLGYFLFATGFSIASGVSWLSFNSPADFEVYFTADLLPKWTLTLACAFSIFFILSTWGWPYTIPTFVFLGVGIFHLILSVQDISIEQAKNDGWLYPPPDSGNGNPLDFVVRLYSINDISWKSIGATLPSIGTAAIITPVFSAIINLLLLETAFPPEEIGKSSLSYELRIDGFIQLMLAVVGGYSTSPTAGGTAVHRKIGARTNWGLFSSVMVHTAFLLVPGSTDVLQYVPKFVVGAVSLIVAISMLYGGLREGYKVLSIKEFLVVLATMGVSIIFGLENGMAAGNIMSFALFIRDAAGAAPVRLDVDSGLIASNTVWGVRSSSIASRVRGAIRIVCLQAYLFFAGTQPALKAAEEQHLKNNNSVAFLVLDFTAVLGMDDSTPIEFRAFMKAAKKARVSVVMCGCSPEIATKLRKVGILAESACTEIHRGEDLTLQARQAASVIDGEPEVYYVGNFDRALELCELALVLRSVDICGDKIAPPSKELTLLARLLHTDLGKFQVQLRPGEAVESEPGMSFILLEGAVKSTVNLGDNPSGYVLQEEIVVYRSLPALENDICFSGGTPGRLEAVEESRLLVLPAHAIDDLHKSNKWRDLELIWSQLAEFLAQSMHPMALKAAMHDIRGRYSSRAYRLFQKAARAKGGSRTDLIKHALASGDVDMTAIAKQITINHGGQQPVFSAFAPHSPRFASEKPQEVTPLVAAMDEDSAAANDEEPLVQFDVGDRSPQSGDEAGQKSMIKQPISRTSTCRSGEIAVAPTITKSNTQDLLDDVENLLDIADDASASGEASADDDEDEKWSTSRSMELCKKGGEALFLGKAQLIPASVATSVTVAVDALNDGEYTCNKGFCVVYDSMLYSSYFLLWEVGQRQAAFERLGVQRSRATAAAPAVLGRQQEAESKPKQAKVKNGVKRVAKVKISEPTEPEAEDSPQPHGSRKNTGLTE